MLGEYLNQLFSENKGFLNKLRLLLYTRLQVAFITESIASLKTWDSRSAGLNIEVVKQYPMMLCSRMRILIARNLFYTIYWPSRRQNSRVEPLTGSTLKCGYITFTVHDKRYNKHKAVNTHLHHYYYSVSHGNLQLLSRFTSRIPHNATSPWMPRMAVNINRQYSFQENIRFLCLTWYSVQKEESKYCSGSR